jgi:RNA polymerase sigma factor (sigma-70 family)
MKDAFTAEELVEIAEKEVMHLPAQEREDAAQEFILGALIAASKAEEGKGVRSYQWSYGRGGIKKFIRQTVRRTRREGESLNQVVKSDGKGVLHLYDVIVDPKAERPETDLDEREAKEQLDAALATLPENYREVIDRRYFQGEGGETVADALGCSRQNVS